MKKAIAFLSICGVIVFGLILSDELRAASSKTRQIYETLNQIVQSDGQGTDTRLKTDPTWLGYFSSSTGQAVIKASAGHVGRILILNAGTNWTVSVYNRATPVGDAGDTPVISWISGDITIATRPHIDLGDVYFSTGVVISTSTTALNPGGGLTAGRLILEYF